MIGPWKMVAPGPMAVDPTVAVEVRQVQIGVDPMVNAADAVSGEIALVGFTDNSVIIPAVANKTPFARVIGLGDVPATPTLMPWRQWNPEKGND